ncbi:PREDICTED: apolipophorins [Habropoda laboriosa]|uniref:apolipophorins n=1 Tax=Habropoda laboriosa TaxID=597456 RepID=UPI00083D0FA7|nr:PREDICTED: apolipophorins [Habropoda laboriosa]
MGHPPRLTGTTLACLLLLFAVAESANKCTVGCHGMQSNKAYQEGHTYVYDLQGQSVTTVADAQGDAKLKLDATVELTVKPDCVHQLRLTNVKINGAHPSTPDVEQYAVQFNYHNGHIDTEICTEPGDSQASLNIKRAVVSMFQSAVMQESGSTVYHETDVLGACPTQFQFLKDGDTQVIRKTKSLEQCAFRENVNQGLISASMDTAAGIKSSPLLGSSQESEQHFKQGVLNKARLRERYTLKPFRNAGSGADTNVETTLTLKSEKGDNPAAPVSQPKSVIFEAPHPVLQSSPEAISNAMKAAKAEVTDGVKPPAARRFVELVKVLRQSNKNDIMSAYQKVKANKEDQRLFLDALFNTGSGEAAEVGADLVKKNELTGVQALLFYASLPLVRHVHLSSMTAVSTLLSQPNLPRLGYLGVGQVIGKFCQDHTCENTPEVKEAVHKIRDKVGNGKAKSREHENTIVVALKALGNTKFLDDATLQKLANIGSDKNVKNRVRVAAIEALPTRCSMKWKNIMFKVLNDKEEDSEVRIKTYLSLVACPCAHVANQLKETLDKEPVNQVGSFIQSHLRNLRASTDPSKLAAKNQLGLIKPRTKYPEDIRKYSSNSELSYKIDAFGVGSTLESNVIYSQNSFVPRSSNLNLTMELFGRNFNFLEIDTRVENLDRMIEHYFGPKGKLWEQDLKDLTSESVVGNAEKLRNYVQKRYENLQEYIKDRYEKTGRRKREVKQGDLDRFAKNVHLRGNEVDQDLDIDLSVKLFGVELAYLSYQGDSSKLNPKAMFDKMFDTLDKGLDLAKNLNYDLEKYLQFLEAELVYPTGMGMALTLGLTGTSAVRVKSNGKLDVKAILKDPKNANVKIALEPSVSVRIAGSMIVQGLGVESGMKLITTLHSATSTDMSVSVLDGKGVDVKFGMPKKKQELINVNSEVVLSTGPKGDKYLQPKFGKSKEYTDCFEQLSGILGVTVCGEISYPYEDLTTILKEKPKFPLSGPAKFAVTLENNDVTNYHFKVYLNTQDPDKRSFEILLDTPKSRTNRRVALKLEAGLKPNMYAKMSLDSPIKTASVEGILKNTLQEHTLSIIILHDKNEYSGRVGVLASGSKYKPVLEYKVPEHIEKLAGTSSGSKGQLYNVQGTVDVSDYQGGQKYVLDKVTLMVGDQKTVAIDGDLAWTPNSVSVDTKLDYDDKNLALKLKGKKDENNYALSMTALPSTDPNTQFSLNWELKRKKDEMENKLTFVHGPDLNSETNRLSLKQKLIYQLNPENPILSTENELTYPALKLKLKVDGKLTKKSVSGDVEVKYDYIKLGSELSAKVNMEKPGDYEVKLKGQLMENSVELKSKRTVLENKKSKYSNSLVLKPGGKYDADATVTYDVSRNNVNVQLDGDLNVNGKKVKVDTGLEANSQLLNSRVFMKIDGVKYIEFVLRTKRTPNPSGTLTLNLKNYVTASGQYTYQNRKGNANLNIDMPKINRKVKATGTLAVSGSQHVGNFEVLYDAEKDPNKRIKFSTISDITKTSVDTKNVLEVLTYKFEVNAKGNLQGTFSNGQLQIEADVTLPNGRYLVYKGNRNSVKKDNTYDVQVNSELVDHEKKGGPSRKLSYVADVKDLNPQDLTFQGTSQLKCVNTDGKDTQIDWSGKHLHQPNKNKQIEVNVGLSGATVPKKFQVKLNTELGESDASYQAQSSLGDDFALTSNGKLEKGNEIDKPYKMNGVLDMKLPLEKLNNLKLEVSGSILESKEKDIMEESESFKLTYNKDKTIQLDSYAKLVGWNKIETEPSEGTGKLTLNVLDLPPLKLTSNYKYSPTPDHKTATVDATASYGDKKIRIRSDNQYLPDKAIVSLQAEGNLLLEKLRNVNLQLDYKRFKTENRWTVDSDVTADGVKYSLNSEVQYLTNSGLFHVTSTCPNGKTELLSKIEKLGDNEYKGEWKVNTPKGFAVTDAHVDLNSVDDFVINANFDSDKIQKRKLHAEISNKPTARTGKRINIVVTSDGQNIVTGSTNYKKREEDGKIVVEGNGQLKIGDDTKTSSFKYTRQQLTLDKDKEVGVAMVLNANFGPSAIVGELKLSNKGVHVFNSYCEQNKDCAQFKLQSILDVEKKTLLKHQITVEVDLKKFNVPAEFGLKTSTEFNNPIFDHTTNLYLHSSKDKSEYTYQAYIHPKEAATVLTLPSREMAAVLIYDLPKTKQTGAYKVDLSVYLDRKNKPNDKTSLSASGDVDIDKNTLSLNGETKFTYPTQTKDMLVKGRLHSSGQQLLSANLDIDLFAKKSQKISITANLKRELQDDLNNITGTVGVTSRGQHLNLELNSHVAVSKNKVGFGGFFTYDDVNQKPKTMGGFFSASLKHITTFLTLPDKELLREDCSMEFSRDTQQMGCSTSLLGETPTVYEFEVKNLNRFMLQAFSKDNPTTKITVNGNVVLGQMAQINVDAYKDNARKNLFHASVHLDEEHFLTPDFGYSKENVVDTMNYLKSKNQEHEKRLKDLYTYVTEQVKIEGTDLLEHLKKAQPNMKPLMEYYQGELNKLKNELQADETIKEIQATLNKYLGAILTAVTEIMKQVAQGLEKLQQQLNEIVGHLKEAVKSVYPQMKKSLDKVFDQGVQILDAVMKLGQTYLKAVLDLINDHQKEIQDFMSVVSGMTQDFAKIITKGLEQIKQNAEEFTTLLVNQLKALPVFEILKEKLEELKKFQIPEHILGPVDEFCKMLKAAMPTNALRELVESSCQYVMKHIKHEKVNELNELKTLYSKLKSAIASILVMLEKEARLDLLSYIQIQAPIDLSPLSQIPGISSVRVSVLNLLRNGELPSLLDLYYAYRPTHLPSDILPPFSKSGVVTGGGHFFTFDGRHLTMPGTCTYVLAQDMQDGNFSVVANFNNGVLISITVTEPKESITLKNNGNILVNNKPADYPANTKNLQAYHVPPFSSVKSDYGVRVTCLAKTPMICAVHVSGFYLGKLRGLLGDGNNEPYDDFTLPSGKITDSGTEFGNAYKLKADCPDATAVHHKDRAAVCTDYFTGQKSSMKSCFDYVNPTQYRDACDHAFAADKEEGACVIASAYHYACYAKGLMSTRIPASCTHCKVGASKVNVFDTFSVKTPKKEADIIFVLEQLRPNDKVYKEMITPLMSELREELKQHGVTDVHIGLIGYSEKMKWPQHYTVNGDTNIVGEVKNLKFDERKPTVSLEEAKEGDTGKKIDYLQQRLDVELGTFKLTDAYEEAIRYPFRPGAAKAVIGVIANPCEKSPFPISMQQIRLLLGQKVYSDLGLTYYHVSFPKELLVSGKPQKNIVGYDQDSVYTFADSKNKPMTGSSDMKSNLASAISDVCADFAVSSGGAAFSSDNFLDAKPGQKKQFVQVATKRIVDGLVNLELEKDCTCDQQFGLTGSAHCKIVGRKDKRTSKSATKG